VNGAAGASLTILDVGHGSCCIITDGPTTILVDAGPGSAVLEYLRQEGIGKIDSIILSHSDADHIRGAIALLGEKQFEVLEIIANSDGLKTSDVWRSLAWEIDNRRRRGLIRSDAQLREGDHLATQVAGSELTVLAPRSGLVLTGPGSRDPLGRLITTNSMSAVILVAAENHRIALLTGDLDELGLEHLLETGQDMTADILVFPHHGGLAGTTAHAAEAFAEKLTAAVQPNDVVFSLDRRRYGTPRPEIIAGVRRAAPDVRIACTQLSEACAAELPLAAPAHLLSLFARGREGNACCAGTMRVVLGDSENLEPKPDQHGSFVRQFALSALCMKPSAAPGDPG
jgi:beta-lactamase superfamily II metal-dependent hydrolase